MSILSHKNSPLQAVQLSRRSLLQGAGSLVVSFTLSNLSETSFAQSVNSPVKSKSNATDEVQGFIAVNNDGSVTIYSGKVDLGTGVRTAIT